jgi:hypothetical protein
MRIPGNTCPILLPQSAAMPQENAVFFIVMAFCRSFMLLGPCATSAKRDRQRLLVCHLVGFSIVSGPHSARIDGPEVVKHCFGVNSEFRPAYCAKPLSHLTVIFAQYGTLWHCDTCCASAIAGVAWASGPHKVAPQNRCCLPPGPILLKGEPRTPVFPANPREK